MNALLVHVIRFEMKSSPHERHSDQPIAPPSESSEIISICHKSATPMTLSPLESRHTYRAYDATYTIPRSQIDEIIRLALLSPTARNLQEIDLIVLVTQSKIDEISQLIISTWPESIRKPRTERILALGCQNVLTCDATALILLVRNEHASQTHWTDFDAGIVAMSVMIAAREFDLHTMCLGLAIRGDKAKVEAALGISEGSLIIGIAVGKALRDSEVKFNKEIIARSTIL
jgi:nitroreductase